MCALLERYNFFGFPLNFLQANRQMIPAMGFSDYFIQNVTENKSDATSSRKKASGEDGGGGIADECDSSEASSSQKSDQEILESITDIYFQPDSNADMYELQVGVETTKWLSGWVDGGRKLYALAMLEMHCL